MVFSKKQKELISASVMCYITILIMSASLGSCRNSALEFEGMDFGNGMTVSVEEHQKYDSVTASIGWVNTSALIVIFFVFWSRIKIADDYVVNAQWKMVGYVLSIIASLTLFYFLFVETKEMIPALRIINWTTFGVILLFLILEVWKAAWKGLLKEGLNNESI